jgi:hypothetical protein
MKIDKKKVNINIKIGIMIIEEIKNAIIEKNIPINGNIIPNKAVKVAMEERNKKNINFKSPIFYFQFSFITNLENINKQNVGTVVEKSIGLKKLK